MSTFLQLVNDLREKCGISGNALTTLSSLSGESLRCKNWINDAYMEIQRRHTNWEWLRTSFNFTTTTSQSTYTLAEAGVSSDFGIWARDTFRCYTTSVGYSSEAELDQMSYDEWRNLWQFGSNRSVTGVPSVFAIAPNKSICLGPAPSSTGFTVIGDYFTVPVEMSADADTPDFPSKFHQLVVFSAMMAYGSYEAAPEVYQRGETRFNVMIAELELDQLPEVTLAGGLL